MANGVPCCTAKAPNGTLVGLWRDHLIAPTQKGKSTIHLVTATNWKDNTTYNFEHTDLLFGDNGLPNPGGVEDPFVYFDKSGVYHALFHMLHPAHPYSSGGHAYSLDGMYSQALSFDLMQLSTSDCSIVVYYYNFISAILRSTRCMYVCIVVCRMFKKCAWYCVLRPSVAHVQIWIDFLVVSIMVNAGRTWTWTGQAYDGNVTFADGSKATYNNGDRPKLIFAKDGVTPVAFTNAVGTMWGAPGMDVDQTFTLLRPLLSADAGG